LFEEIDIQLFQPVIEEMTNERKIANNLTDAQEMAEAYCNKSENHTLKLSEIIVG
jgi:hypothetical protein